MSFDIGPKIGIEGDKEYRQAISQIETGMKVLKSEMQAVTSEFDKNEKSTESLTAKKSVLSKQIDLQKEKVAQLESALKNSADTYGENDTATQNWQIKLNKATAELNRMQSESEATEQDLDKLKTGLKDSGDEADKSGNKFEKLGGVLKNIGVAMGAAAVAAGAAAVKLATEVTSQFGELEQNLGGSEAVFGKYADSIKKTGEDAYKNMGISQSEYLATANKMGSLFQGSGIEQQKSLQLTEKAMQRAADVASVMGIDMQMAMDSVAGAAKGNFTMMDNLGVAMNATSIEAYAAGKGLDFVWNKASQAEKNEIAMQMFFEKTEQYAGNFAKESTETMSGSMGLLEAALGSFTAGLGNADADMAKLTGNLVDAFGSVVKNIVPVIQNIVKALPSAVDAIVSGMEELLPDLLVVFQDLFTQILQTILTMLPRLIPAAISILMTLVQALIDNLPLIITAAIQLIVALVEGMSDALPELIPAAIDAILTIIDALLENLPMLIDVAIDLILALVDGLLKALPELLKRAPEIIRTLIDGIVQAIPKLIDAAIEIIMSLIDYVLDPNNMVLLIKAALDIMLALAEGIIRAIPDLVAAIPKVIKKIYEKFKDTNWGEIGKNILQGIGDGLVQGAKKLVSTVKDVAGNVADGFKSFFGIHSPSRLMRDDVGKMLGLGMAEGIEDSMAKVHSAMGTLNNEIVRDASIPAQSQSGSNSTLTTINNNAPERVISQVVLDSRVVAEAVAPIISRAMADDSVFKGKAAGFA